MPPVMNEIGTDYTLLKAAFDDSEVVFQFMSSKSEKSLGNELRYVIPEPMLQKYIPLLRNAEPLLRNSLNSDTKLPDTMLQNVLRI